MNLNYSCIEGELERIFKWHYENTQTAYQKYLSKDHDLLENFYFCFEKIDHNSLV